MGVLISDTSLGIPPDSINELNTIVHISRDVFIRHHRYHNTPLDQLIDRLLRSPRLTSKENCLPGWKTDISPEIRQPDNEEGPIKVRHLIHILNEFVTRHPQMPIVSDTGDCLFASVDIRANICVGPAYYATMGFSVPGALGVQISSGMRPLVLVGDGAFQMTGSEISLCRRYRLNPILVLFNNNRWEMLQAFFPEAHYNETASWPFAKLGELWGGRGFEVQTPRQLRDALAAAEKENRFSLIEVKLARGDLSPILRRFVREFKRHVSAS